MFEERVKDLDFIADPDDDVSIVTNVASKDSETMKTLETESQLVDSATAQTVQSLKVPRF